MESFSTKIEAVKGYLESGRIISSWSAIQLFGVTRLSAVIYKLKKRGMDIASRMVYNPETRSSYSEYWLQTSED